MKVCFAAAIWFMLSSYLLPCQAIAQTSELSVAAASDLIYAFKSLGSSFEKRHRVNLKWIFGSSGILSVQIQGGMEVDVFASAHPEWVDRLAGKGLVKGESRKVFALGRIVLSTPQRSSYSLNNLEDLVDHNIRRITIAHPSHAPYGVAAKEALERTGIWEKVKHKIVYAENVLQAQVYVRQGEVDAGIIALSLAGIPEIRSTPIPASLHRPIQQTIAVLKGSKNESIAQGFIDYMTGKEGTERLMRYGFSRP